MRFAGESRRRCVLRPGAAGAALVATGALLLAAARPAAAQGPQPATAQVTINIPAVLYLGCPSPCSFTFPDADDAAYQTTYLASTSGPTLIHRGNVPYRITISAQTTELQFSNLAGRSDPNPHRPTTDLTLRATTGTPGSWMPLAPSGSSATLYTRSGPGGNQTSVVDAHLALDYATNPPGQYQAVVVFTIVAP